MKESFLKNLYKQYSSRRYYKSYRVTSTIFARILFLHQENVTLNRFPANIDPLLSCMLQCACYHRHKPIPILICVCITVVIITALYQDFHLTISSRNDNWYITLRSNANTLTSLIHLAMLKLDTWLSQLSTRANNVDFIQSINTSALLNWYTLVYSITFTQ